MSTAALILAVSALSTAVFHTLIPDHWLPFVLIGRVRNWPVRRTVVISGFSAFLHVSLSLALGLLGMVIGLGTSMAAGEALERVSGLLLILFGAFYAYWAFRKGGHFHIGGERVHLHEHGREEHNHAHEKHEQGPAGDDQSREEQDHGPAADEQGHEKYGLDLEDKDHHAPVRDASVSRRAEEEEQVHWQKDSDLISGKLAKSDFYLATIIGLNPCVLIFPILFAAASYGYLIISTVVVLYSVSTILMMIGMTVLGLRWARKIKMRFFSRYGEILSGLLITLMGIIFLFIEL